MRRTCPICVLRSSSKRRDCQIIINSSRGVRCHFRFQTCTTGILACRLAHLYGKPVTHSGEIARWFSTLYDLWEVIPPLPPHSSFSAEIVTEWARTLSRQKKQ